MDHQIILDKLTSLKRCIERIESRTPKTVDALFYDFDCQDIISLNLQRAVQVCVDIASHISADIDTRPPSSMAQSFDNLKSASIISDDLCTKMKKSVGYRNIAVHEYSTINWNMVFSIITNNLDDFREFAKSIFAWLKTSEK